jgi:hypothetical protein
MARDLIMRSQGRPTERRRMGKDRVDSVETAPAVTLLHGSGAGGRAARPCSGAVSRIANASAARAIAAAAPDVRNAAE